MGDPKLGKMTLNIYKVRKRLYQIAHAQTDQGILYPLIELLDMVEYINNRKRSWLDGVDCAGWFLTLYNVPIPVSRHIKFIADIIS